MASRASAHNETSDPFVLPLETTLGGAWDSQGRTSAGVILGGRLFVWSPDLLPRGGDFVDGGWGGLGAVAVSGNGERTRVVVRSRSSEWGSEWGARPALDVYAVTSGGLVLERTIVVKEALPGTALAGSGAHSDIVVGPLKPDAATSFWNPVGTFLRRISLETGETVGEVFSVWGRGAFCAADRFRPRREHTSCN